MVDLGHPTLADGAAHGGKDCDVQRLRGWRHPEDRVGQDTALHLMDWEGQGPDGLPFRALSVAVLTREAAGAWRMVIDHPFGNGLLERR